MASPATKIENGLPRVALVGRVNVGKSTLFNRLIEKQHALISKIAGTTRTQNVGTAIWRAKNFEVVDTGGLEFNEDIPLDTEIIEQTKKSLETSDLILFIIDIQTGVLPQEKKLAKIIKTNYKSKKVVLVANKADSPKWEGQQYDSDILKLNLGEPFLISAQSGRNIGDLLDLIYDDLKALKKRPKKTKVYHPTKIVLMGKPNVGKSSLFNKLIGEDKVIVSPMAHTTREPFDTLVEYEKKPYLFIDTAGIRKKTKVKGELEKLGVQKSIQNVKEADIVLLLLDATDVISDQDQQLGGYLKEHSKSTIIVINKWDLADDNSDAFRNDVKAEIYSHFPHLDFAPIFFISAKTGYKIQQIFPAIKQADNERKIEIPQDVLDKFLEKITKRKLPSRGKGTKHPKLISLKQLNAGPPIFELIIKARTSLHSSYINYIINRLREDFSFYAAPIVVKITKFKK